MILKFRRMPIAENLLRLLHGIPAHVKLVAVSKTYPAEAVHEAYLAGQRIFGENRVQEMVEKQPLLPEDIEWHLIGHLQKNKVKYIAPFVSMIHSIDSTELLGVVNKEAGKAGRIIPCLIQIHIAREDTKFGFSFKEATELFGQNLTDTYPHVQISGLMGMATFTDDQNLVRNEFHELAAFFRTLKAGPMLGQPGFREISMGMSSDFQLAIEEGATMVRIGSAIFGRRS